MKLTAVVSGNITGDPEQYTPENGEYVSLKFSVANNDRQKKQQDGTWKDEPSFLDVVYWTKNPSYWIQRIQKGSKFFANCEFYQERWEKDGVKRSKIVFRVSDKFPEIFHKADVSTSQPSASQLSAGGPFEDDIPF